MKNCFPGTISNIAPIEKIPYNTTLWTEKPVIGFVLIWKWLFTGTVPANKTYVTGTIGGGGRDGGGGRKVGCLAS